VRTPVVYSAEPPKVKVMTFNTGQNNGALNERYDETLVIAGFVKQQNLEIVALQERDFESIAVNDEALFRNAFTEAGYPMNIIQVQEAAYDANIILSKYPFIVGSNGEYAINGNRNKIVQRVAVQTPYGKLWVVNAHTNPTSACGDSFAILDQITNPASPISIPTGEDVVIMGDFSMYLDESGNVTTCESAPQVSTVNTKLQQFKTACTTAGTCSNRNNPATLQIKDLVITVLSSQTTINSAWENIEIKNQGDGHPVILGIVESPNFTPAAEPPTPTATPTPEVNTTLTVTRSRPKIEEMSYYDGGKWDDLMYYAVFSLGYLTLIRFGFYIHRFFNFFLLTLVFVAGLGITFAFGLPAGLFVVIMGSFMIMMQ